MRRIIAYFWRMCFVAFVLVGCGNQMVTMEPEDSSNPSTGVQESAEGEDVTFPSSEDVTSELDADSKEQLPVYVCGAVRKPGVYYLNPGAIKGDAISMAGGFTEEAQQTYVNLAQEIIGGERIYVPTVEELAGGSPVWEEEQQDTVSTQQPIEGKVNLNTATKEELMTLPGIGENKADAIISYRETQGGFQRPEDIMNISGIKGGVYDKIKEFIVVN